MKKFWAGSLKAFLTVQSTETGTVTQRINIS